MANFLYDSAREKFLSGELSWINDDIRVAMLVNNIYTGNDYSRENHITLSDLPVSAIYKTSTPLTNKEATNGIANAAPVVFRGVPAGVSITSVVIYRQGSSAVSSPLIAHIDVQLDTTGLDDVSIQWKTTDNKIFKL
jgi:hypothetical protein